MLSLYLHIPFCQVRCAYCDFNTYAGQEALMPAYARALVRELRLVGQACPPGVSVHTVFFGGGTPSLLPLPLYSEIFTALREAFTLVPNCEISLEANPGTVDSAYLHGLAELGVNRLSFGVQSSHEWELRLLDRLHTFEDVVSAVSQARAAGFDPAGGLNLDLILALPHQTLEHWRCTLQRTLELHPEHLSIYALSLENGTPLRSWVNRGLLPMPDPDLAAEMYMLAADLLAGHGYQQYEISNWARDAVPGPAAYAAGEDVHTAAHLPAFACRHNLQYWRNQPYLGLGAGAHGFVPSHWPKSAGGHGWRYSNALAPGAYISRLQAENGTAAAAASVFSPAAVNQTAITPEVERNEVMMLGLRLTAEGVTHQRFESRFGVSLDDAFPRQLRRLQALDLIERDDVGVRLTPGARLLGNRVFREFV